MTEEQYMKDFMAVNLAVPTTSNQNFNDVLISTITINEVFLGVPPDNSIASGIITVIQMITKALLTKKGSNELNPDEGCSLLTYVGNVITPSNVKEITLEISQVLQAIKEQILAMQDSMLIPEEQKIVNITLTNLEFDVATTTLNVLITIETLNSGVTISVVTK